MKSAFLRREAVYTADEFIGRQEEIAWVRDKLERQFPQNCNIVGEPRIGKTSLLYRVYDTLLTTSENFAVWVRLSEMPDKTSLGFWQYMLERLRIAKRELWADEPLNFVRDGDPREVFGRLEGELSHLCESEQRRVVFLVDNAELLLLGKDMQAEDHNWLRALVTRYASCVAFVMSSADPLHSLYTGRFETPVSPFMNLFHDLHLGLLSIDEAFQFVHAAARAERMSLSQQDVEFLITEAGPHPDLLKIACGHLFEDKRTHRKAESALQVYNDLRDDIRYDGHVRRLCERLIQRRVEHDYAEWQTLCALVDGTPDVDRTVLRHLEKHLGLIRQREGKPSLFGDAFAYWVGRLKDRRDSVQTQKLSVEAQTEPTLEYSSQQREVRVGERVAALTPVEHRVLDYLWSNADKVCTTEEILEQVWGAGRSISVVEKAVNRLRTKVEIDPRRPRYILSVRGEGYMLRGITESGQPARVEP